MTENQAPYNEQSKNPFGKEVSIRQETSVIAGAEQQRAIAEIQSAMVIAKRFPRDQMAAMDRILRACTRPTLAEGALYTYTKGGTEITGPSIRLAEAIAQAWGNMQFGIRELDQRDGESTVEAYSWDIESNTRQVKVFHVKHKIKAYGSLKELTDPRDIYELTANQGARRLRACILGTVPGDVVEAAVKQCEETMETSCDTSPEKIKIMVESFGKYRVTADMIKIRIQCNVEAIRPAQMVQLKKIYASMRDGMSKASDWFEIAPEGGDINDKINAATAEKKEETSGKSKSEVDEAMENQKAGTSTTTSNPSEDELPPWHPDNHKGKRWQGLVIFANTNKDTWADADTEHQDLFLTKWSKVVGSKDICPVSKVEPPAKEKDDETEPVIGEDGRKIDFYKYHIDAANSKVTLNQFCEEHHEAIDAREDANEIWDIYNDKLESVSKQ